MAVATRSEEIATLLQAGVRVCEVAEQVGVSRQFVHRVRVREHIPLPQPERPPAPPDPYVIRLEQERRWQTVRITRRCLKCSGRVFWEDGDLSCVNCGAWYSGRIARRLEDM